MQSDSIDFAIIVILHYCRNSDTALGPVTIVGLHRVVIGQGKTGVSYVGVAIELVSSTCNTYDYLKRDDLQIFLSTEGKGKSVNSTTMILCRIKSNKYHSDGKLPILHRYWRPQTVTRP